MTITTSLTGRLRNTSLPKSRPLLPLFEAVVNAIQAVDEAHADMDSARIEIRIIRYQQAPLQFTDDHQVPSSLEPIRSFIVSDNGEGFHDENMRSFETLDSMHWSQYGCCGVGRLLWLKAFSKVEVCSRYLDAKGIMKEREFVFTASSDVSSHNVQDSPASETGSEVRLLSFSEYYRQSAPKHAEVIAKSILEHCLWYFVRSGGAPQITIIDDSQGAVDMNSVYGDYMLNASETETVMAKDHPFDLIHLRLKTAGKPTPQLNWCAANRVVLEENLSGKIPGLHGKLSDGEAEFMYVCFLTSTFLDSGVRPERTAFDIPEVTEGALDHNDPSMSDIRAAVLKAVEQHLQPNLTEARQAGRARVEDFVDHKAPRYRSILKHIDEDKLSVDPAIGDKELELQLHRYYVEFDTDLLAEGLQVLDSDNEDDQQYQERLQKYLAKVEDVKKSDLAAYVSRRRVILDLLAKAIRADRQGKYSREEFVHNLIFPMRQRATTFRIRRATCGLSMKDLPFIISSRPIRLLTRCQSRNRL